MWQRRSVVVLALVSRSTLRKSCICWSYTAARYTRGVSQFLVDYVEWKGHRTYVVDAVTSGRSPAPSDSPEAAASAWTHHEILVVQLRLSESHCSDHLPYNHVWQCSVLLLLLIKETVGVLVFKTALRESNPAETVTSPKHALRSSLTETHFVSVELINIVSHSECFYPVLRRSLFNVSCLANG